MKNAIKVIYMWFLLLFFLNSYGQNTIYGVTGIIKTPNAYTVDNGKCVIGLSYFDDYDLKHNDLYETQSINFNFGILTRLEVGVRLKKIPDLPGDSPIFDGCFDRMLNGKIVLFKEKTAIPQIAFGMQDIEGTRIHNSTYLVASKTIPIKEILGISLNLGYGNEFNELILGNAHNHHLIGLFGGTEIGFKKTIFLTGEYDARDTNAGLKIAFKDWLYLNFSLLKMEIPSGGISLKFTI